MIRRHSSPATSRIDHIFNDLHLHYGDVTDLSSCQDVAFRSGAEEIYNLAAQSHVRTSFDIPTYTTNTVALGALNMLQCARELDAKIYQASSSEMFGLTHPPQDEFSEFHPRSPYACAKVYAYHLTVNYRESYNLFASNGILFNHESPRRGETFVTRKIAKAAVAIKRGQQEFLYLGNLDARRDWGHAKDFVEAMWLILQQENPDDFVIATGESHTVLEFLQAAFEYVNLNWHDYVRFDQRLLRPAEVPHLLGNSEKARNVLGWTPKFTFTALVEDMMEAELAQ
jgi:GDPmannose 4,6-dehydratase